ncbi:hypothetical protein AD930_11760 [Acetobacter malorum]|nr:hypothetical protein AD930_11760 [Acetobacter malorum]
MKSVLNIRFETGFAFYAMHGSRKVELKGHLDINLVPSSETDQSSSLAVRFIDESENEVASLSVISEGLDNDIRSICSDVCWDYSEQDCSKSARKLLKACAESPHRIRTEAEFSVNDGEISIACTGLVTVFCDCHD